MPRGGSTARTHFTGPQKLATVDDVEAFVRRASAGDEFTYCEAPDLIRGETSARVSELVGDGLLRPHHRRRAGGGWVFYIVRTPKAQKRKATPVEAALADAATETIFRALKRAANFGQPCPSDEDLRRRTGLSTRAQAPWRVRRLAEVGLIESTLAYEGGVPRRVVTVVETGKRTALPGKWKDLQAAAAKDVRAAAKGAARPASPTYPRGRSGAW